MRERSASKAAQARARVTHPIIDSDGHIVELMPVFLDYLRRVAGADLTLQFESMVKQIGSLPASARHELWLARGPFWGVPSKQTLDRMTVSLPRLLASRLDDLGLDYAVLYPTLSTIFLWAKGSSELDLVGCRAYNEFVADQFGEFAQRLTPAALIPMYRPADALAELEHAHGLGLKVPLLAAFVRRPIPAIVKAAPQIASQPQFSAHCMRLDAFGIDSEYDYDPVWQKCVDLKLPITMHGFALGFTDRASPTNYVHNHMGHFAAAQEAACRSLFMGGVTRRFPALKFGFLEGGVGWAARLLNDIAGRWKKRSLSALRENLDPNLLDLDLARRLYAEYADPSQQGKVEQVLAALRQVMAVDSPDSASLDEFAALGMQRLDDLQALFVDNFYFGCEADDPLVVSAFDRDANPLRARLKPLFGSDMGHWDVTDLSEPVAEAYELLEHGRVQPDDFRAFTCDNAVELYTATNPDFFAGTVLEDYARARSRLR